VGRNALHYAAHNGDEAIVEYLLGRGLRVNAKDEDGTTPLYDAARYGHLGCVRLLLDNGANTEALERDSSRTALHNACEYGWEAVVQLLLARGASYRARDHTGRTALALASECGHVGVVRAILKRAGEEEREKVVEDATDDETTPLMLAASSNHLEAVKALLSAGASMTKKNAGGWTALHFAAEADAMEIGELLLDRGADIAALTGSGKRPYEVAGLYGGETGEAVRLRWAQAHGYGRRGEKSGGR
jgi:ankyrin repeat protein